MKRMVLIRVKTFAKVPAVDSDGNRRVSVDRTLAKCFIVDSVNGLFVLFLLLLYLCDFH